jgi:hypothetical protein
MSTPPNWRRRVAWFVVVACVLVTAWSLLTRGRVVVVDRGPAAERIVRVYDVGDLMDLPVFEPDWLENHWRLPPTPPTSIALPASGLGREVDDAAGGRWHMMEYTGGLFGPKPNVSAPTTPPHKQRLDELVWLVKEGVDPSSWGAGTGSATGVNRRLVVVQTRRNQELVAALLEELRADPPRQVTVEAVWARLSTDELARSIVPGGDAAVRAVDLGALERSGAVVAYRGQALGVSGQWTRVSCGRARTVLTGAEAVIGDKQAALDGRWRRLLDGAAVDVRASLAPEGRRVRLDVRGEVTRRVGPELPPIEMPGPVVAGGPVGVVGAKVDRLNLGVQSIATSVRGPTGAALLVGGTSEEDDGGGRQLYLIVRVSAKVAEAAKR